MTKIVKSPSGRPTRTPIGKRNRLTVKNQDPNFVYRVVNDEGDRVQMFLDNGWEIEDASAVRVGDKRVDVAAAPGSKAQVSVGGKMSAFIMKIPKEWFDEDQNAKEAHLKSLEANMKQNALNSSDYGKIELTRD